MAEKKTKRTKKATASKEETKTTREEAEVHTESGAKNAVFSSAEEFTECVNGYFEEADREGKLYSDAGMALYLTRHNKKGKSVTPRALKAWWFGERCKYLQEAVELAFLRIQEQILTDDRYKDKTMSTRAIFMLKQMQYGGYTDRPQEDKDITVNVNFGENMDASDFK